MRRGRRQRGGEAGVTLVELMISLVVLGIAIGAVFQMGIVMVRSAADHRKSTQVEQAARSSMDIISMAVRNASPGVTRGNLGDLVGCTGSGGINVINHTDRPDELEVIHARGGFYTSVRRVFQADHTQLQVMDATGLNPGDYIVVTNINSGHILEITDVQPAGAEWVLTLAGAPNSLCGATPHPSLVFPSAGYQPGDLVLQAQPSLFYVDASGAVGNMPTLMMDPDNAGPMQPEPLAAGIEDFQVAVGVDLNADGSISEGPDSLDEVFYNVPGDLAPPPLVDIAAPVWRALRITVVARSLVEQESAAIYFRPQAEDHPAASTNDVFRRRVMSSIIEIRNMEKTP